MKEKNWNKPTLVNLMLNFAVQATARTSWAFTIARGMGVVTRSSLRLSLQTKDVFGKIKIEDSLPSNTWLMQTPSKKRKNSSTKIVTPDISETAHEISTTSRCVPDAKSINESIPFSCNSNYDAKVLLELDPECVRATLVNRPSKRNRSPYVADIFVPSIEREAICHVPNLDMGGKCVSGVQMLVKPQRDPKTKALVGPNAVSSKYGTPKCEFVAQLLYVNDAVLHESYKPAWVGANPSLGESIAKNLLEQGHLDEIWNSKVISTKTQVSKLGDTNMRADFVVTHENGRKRVIEVKTVVDTDYCADLPLPAKVKCLFTNNAAPENYKRSAIFPWGKCNQKGPNGEKVVSARAIKHVMELTSLVREKTFDATVLFIVIRGDAETFRPNHEACPTFARYLKEAHEKGVQVLAKCVRWEENITSYSTYSSSTFSCIADKWLDIDWTHTS